MTSLLQGQKATAKLGMSKLVETIGQRGAALAFLFLKRLKSSEATSRERSRTASAAKATPAFFSSATDTNPQDIARVELTASELGLSDILKRVSAKQRARTIEDSEWGYQLEED